MHPIFMVKKAPAESIQEVRVKHLIQRILAPEVGLKFIRILLLGIGQLSQVILMPMLFMPPLTAQAYTISLSQEDLMAIGLIDWCYTKKEATRQLKHKV